VNGVISVIRRRMGDGAPCIAACRNTLQRIAADEDSDLNFKQNKGGRPRAFTTEEDLYAGLIICEGHSQRSATFLINGERSAQGKVAAVATERRKVLRQQAADICSPAGQL